MTPDPIRSLVERIYPALATGDRAEVESVLHPSFEAHFSPGLPAPVGGHHVGAADCIDNGWWTIGARWRVRAQPVRWLPSGPGELVVLGDYIGTSRKARLPLDAPFAHAWTADGGLLRSLHQYTDTALWRDSLGDM